MNHCVISGKITGNIDKTISDTGMIVCKFNIANIYYKPKVNASEKTLIRCIAYGALAEYVYNEMYDGCSILVTGRVLNRHYISNGVHIDRVYVGCDTVSRLDQEDYS